MFTHSEALALRQLIRHTCPQWYAVCCRDSADSPQHRDPIWFLAVAPKGTGVEDEDGTLRHVITSYAAFGSFIRQALVVADAATEVPA